MIYIIKGKVMNCQINFLVFFLLTSFLILTCSCFSPVQVYADEIFLDNGDRITGKIITMEEGRLTIATSYAGDISVTWADIENVKTDDPVKVLLKDETFIQGIIKESTEGKIKLETVSIHETVSFDLADVKSINQAPADIEPTVKLKARFNLGSTSAKGNTETESQHFDGEFVARTEKNRYTVGAEINRAEDDGEPTVNNSIGYIKYDHFLTDKWFLYSNALFEKDRFKDLNLRTALGLGAGYQILESQSINLSGEAGLTYINKDFDNAPDEGYPAGRWAVNFDKYFFDKFIQFFHFNEGFFGVEDRDDILIRSRTGFRIPVYKAFNATFQINYDWDKRPSPGLKKTDMMYILSLGYQIDK